MSLPPHVTHVQANAIVIANLDRYTVRKLRAAGVKIDWSWFTGYGEVAIERAEGSELPSKDEEEKLMALARLGIAFAYDYKQGWDPASRMLELCRAGRYVGTFKQLSFSEKGPRIVVMPAGDEAFRRSQRDEERSAGLLRDDPGAEGK